jgi:hypothetical protein
MSPARALAGSIALVVVLAALLFARLGYDRLGLAVGEDEYSVAGWEVRNLPGKWLFLFGRLFAGKPTLVAENAAVLRFLTLTREIESLEREGVTATTSPALVAKRRERDEIENRVEATIEGRITAIAEREGLTRSLSVLPDMVFPPVDLEFALSPQTVATSRRDRIELLGTDLLRLDLTAEEVAAAERRREERDGVSALAFPTGGIGAYPTVVAYETDYRQTVEVAAHEWMHNYLAFRPLGVRYYASNQLRTLNETVADLVGREIADLVVAAWPLTEAAPAAPPSRPSAGRGAAARDFGEQLRALRGEVDVLLAAGRVEEAEALMEQRRLELWDQGLRLRRLNQAYFAFTNLYAGEGGSPAATNPIGPKVDELRRRSSSLRQFVSIAGDLTSVADLDRALASLP